MTDLKRFSANSVPAALRQPAWNDMLTQVGLASRVATPACGTTRIMLPCAPLRTVRCSST
ncbi:hypothetical protein ULG90_02485 [Halopseudomonas pachastrellae]|nr:hypothetical protein ULG90_02485 [Halopseudomonas pachastrellae]